MKRTSLFIVFLLISCRNSTPMREFAQGTSACEEGTLNAQVAQPIAGGLGVQGYEALRTFDGLEAHRQVSGAPFRISENVDGPRRLSGFLDDSILGFIGLNPMTANHAETIEVDGETAQLFGDIVSITMVARQFHDTSSGNVYRSYIALQLPGGADISELRLRVSKHGHLWTRRIYLITQDAANSEGDVDVAEGDLAEDGQEFRTYRWLTYFTSIRTVYIGLEQTRTVYRMEWSANGHYQLVRYVDAISEVCGPVTTYPALISSRLRYRKGTEDLSAPLVRDRDAISALDELHSFGYISEYIFQARTGDAWARFWHYNRLGVAENLGWLSERPCNAVLGLGMVDFTVGKCRLQRSIVLADKRVNIETIESTVELLPAERKTSNVSPEDLWYLLSSEARPFSRYACDVTSVALPPGTITVAAPFSRCGVGLDLEFIGEF